MYPAQLSQVLISASCESPVVGQEHTITSHESKPCLGTQEGDDNHNSRMPSKNTSVVASSRDMSSGLQRRNARVFLGTHFRCLIHCPLGDRSLVSRIEAISSSGHNSSCHCARGRSTYIPEALTWYLGLIQQARIHHPGRNLSVDGSTMFVDRFLWQGSRGTLEECRWSATPGINTSPT